MASSQGTRSCSWWAEITMGANAGAIISLGDGLHGFGRDCDNDVVLGDDAVAEHHASVEISDQGAVLVSLAAGARLASRALDAGREVPLRDGAELSLGDTVLRFHGPRAGWRAKAEAHLPRARLRWALPAAVCTVAMLSLVPLHLGAATTSQAGVAAVRHAALIHAGPGPASAQAVALPGAMAHEAGHGEAGRRDAGARQASLARALEMLRGRLVEAKLDGSVEVSGADGAVLATGALRPVDRDRWLATQMWFDGALRDHVTLVDKVGPAQAEDAPRFDIRAVSMGAVPFVVTGSGDRYAEGAILAGGWTIGRIAAEKVTLLNGSRSLDITL